MCFSFSIVFRFLAIFQVLQLCISHFLTFTMFLGIFHVLQSLCLLVHIFQFSRHSPGPTVFIPHFPLFWEFLVIFQVKECLCPVFQFFSPYCRSYSVHFSFSTFSNISCHIPGPTVFAYNFPHFSFFHAILHFLPSAFFNFHVFECFSPYCRCYSVCFSFSFIFTLLAILQFIHFPLFWVFLVILHVQQCLCLIFNFFF